MRVWIVSAVILCPAEQLIQGILEVPFAAGDQPFCCSLALLDDV